MEWVGGHLTLVHSMVNLPITTDDAAGTSPTGPVSAGRAVKRT